MSYQLKRPRPFARRKAGRSGWVFRVGGLLAAGALMAGCAGTGVSDSELTPESVLPMPATSEALNEPGEASPPAASEAPVASAPSSLSAGSEPPVPLATPEPPVPLATPSGASGSGEIVPPTMPAAPDQSAPADPGFVAMCPYDDGSGVLVSLPCDAPQFASASPALPSEPAEITCQTPCTSSGCEQYKEFVLNC